MSGLLITFEGGEGCGKSTQMAIVAQRLRDAGVPVRALREPGDTVLGEAVRRILLEPSGAGVDPIAELLLFEASRAQLLFEAIRPALERGETVLCDRYTDSTTAYQGYARGVDLDLVAALNAAATGGLVPDRTLVFDVEAAVALSRATAGGADRIESEESEFHERVRQGFLRVAVDDPERVRVVDAAGTIERVAERTAAALADLPGLGVLQGPAR